MLQRNGRPDAHLRKAGGAAFAAALIAMAGAAGLHGPHARAAGAEAGRKVFEAHCANCHGADLKGIPAQHTPDLTDDKWLFGGDDLDTFMIRPADVEKVVRFGLRSGHPQGNNLAVMPARGASGDLTDAEIEDLTEYVLKLGGQSHDAARAERGAQLYQAKGGCFDCHVSDGAGDPAIGSTNLTLPGAYLYGSDRSSIRASIAEGRKGVSPAFEGKLSEPEIKAVAAYVHASAKGWAF